MVSFWLAVSKMHAYKKRLFIPASRGCWLAAAVLIVFTKNRARLMATHDHFKARRRGGIGDGATHKGFTLRFVVKTC